MFHLTDLLSKRNNNRAAVKAAVMPKEEPKVGAVYLDSATVLRIAPDRVDVNKQDVFLHDGAKAYGPFKVHDRDVFLAWCKDNAINAIDRSAAVARATHTPEVEAKPKAPKVEAKDKEYDGRPTGKLTPSAKASLYATFKAYKGVDPTDAEREALVNAAELPRNCTVELYNKVVAQWRHDAKVLIPIGSAEPVRLEKGRALAKEVLFLSKNERYLHANVPSTNGGWYVVIIAKPETGQTSISCTCPDSRHAPGRMCKHAIAAAIAHQM